MRPGTRASGSTAAVAVDTRVPGAHPVLRVLAGVLPALLVGAVALWAQATGSWSRFGIPSLGRTFGDLRAVTSAAGCAERDPSWSVRSPTCDPFHRPYNYPSIWARTGQLFGIDERSTDAIGLGLIVLFVLTVAVLGVLAASRRRPVAGIVTMLIAAVSPPSLFALERGNIDIVVFAVVVAGIACTALGAEYAAAVLFGVAVPLKIYPLGTLLGLGAARVRRGPLVVFAGVALLGLALEAEELAAIASGTPQYAQGSFGASVLPILLDDRAVHDSSALVDRAAGLALLLAGSLIALWCTRAGSASRFATGWRRLIGAVRADRTAAALIGTGAGCVLVAYAVGSSFDYRLIFLLPVVAGLARIPLGASRAALPALVVGFLLLYITYPFGQAQYVGDVLWLAAAPMLVALAADLPGLRSAVLARLRPARAVAAR